MLPPCVGGERSRCALKVTCFSLLASALRLLTPKIQAVCRAVWRGERSRCAVRMTAKGSVTPWMACGSRPVEGSPALGLSRQSAYAKARDCQGGGLFPLGPPPFAAGEQNTIVCKAEPDQSTASRASLAPTFASYDVSYDGVTHPNPKPPVGPSGGAAPGRGCGRRCRPRLLPDCLQKLLDPL